MEKDVVPLLNAEDPELWRETIRNGYTRAFVLFALLETGVLDVLRKAGAAGKTAAELAAECNVDEKILDNILTYMALSDVVLEKKDGRFSFTDKGEWIYQPRMLHLLYNNVGSYGITLQELVPSLRGEKKYGKDFVRRGDYLAVGTQNITVESQPGILSAIQRLGVKRVVDLGCGSAHWLVKCCKLAPDVTGVGVDISTGALSESKKTIEKAGLTDRVRLVHGDVGDPDTYAKEIGDVELFNCVAVMHEFLRDGEDAVFRILSRMKALFPGRYMTMAEFNRREDEEFASIPAAFRYRWLFYQYIMHPLSNQGLMSRQRWMAMFERCGIHVESVESFNLDVYLVRF